MSVALTVSFCSRRVVNSINTLKNDSTPCTILSEQQASCLVIHFTSASTLPDLFF